MRCWQNGNNRKRNLLLFLLSGVSVHVFSHMGLISLCVIDRVMKSPFWAAGKVLLIQCQNGLKVHCSWRSPVSSFTGISFIMAVCGENAFWTTRKRSSCGLAQVYWRNSSHKNELSSHPLADGMSGEVVWPKKKKHFWSFTGKLLCSKHLKWMRASFEKNDIDMALSG